MAVLLVALFLATMLCTAEPRAPDPSPGHAFVKLDCTASGQLSVKAWATVEARQDPAGKQNVPWWGLS